MRGDSYQLQGQQGGIVLTAGQSAPGPFRWILVVNDAILAGFGGNLRQDSGMQSSVTLPAGFGFGGVIIDLEITSGIVIAYDL